MTRRRRRRRRKKKKKKKKKKEKKKMPDLLLLAKQLDVSVEQVSLGDVNALQNNLPVNHNDSDGPTTS